MPSADSSDWKGFRTAPLILNSFSGDRSGQFSIRINKQWRICFAWDGNDAVDVEITDYH
ncbi:MAG: type II toxin-antitoxin system RelE/ParE family toxin [Deltaproteobacteria bacterium]|nr:type II toxin-antitoxin system RelE/ParE family toxin [Deltaproteobacteria bacterium]